MHDYPDDKCRTILQHTVAAMSADSVVLLDDVVLPDHGAHPYSLDKDTVSPPLPFPLPILCDVPPRCGRREKVLLRPIQVGRRY